MADRSRVGAGRGQFASVNLDEWVDVDIDALDPVRRAQFLKRRQAVTMYLAGQGEAAIKGATGIARSNEYRLISNRCLAQHPDGTLMGWRGAIPHYRVVEYSRRSPLEVRPGAHGGAVGALQWLFRSAGGAEIELAFRNRILKTSSGLASGRRPKQQLFNWFLERLRKDGYEARGEWPFNVARLGCSSIYRFIDKVLDENPRQKLKQLGGPEGERKARAGDGTRRPELKVFQRVECDAHKIDARMVVLMPSPHGGYEPRKINRLWVIVLIEVASRAVLGYQLSMRLECSAEDVLRAIKSALTRWQPRELHWSEHGYAESAALPSGHGAQYIGACWDEFSVDGAMANICARVETQLKEAVGAAVIKPQNPNSFSARRSKDDRPFIESFFKQLAGGGFHRLATTTGSKPADRRGAKPEKVAMEVEFQLEYAEELLDALIANYNARPHSGLGWRSPLQQLDFLTRQRGTLPRQANPDDVKRMVGIRKLCTVKGGVASGRRLHFNFMNASYSAEWLAARLDLAGKNLWLQVEDEDDARFASVSTQRGDILGVVRAAPPWHLSPHTLYMRQAIRALAARRLLHLSTQGDPIEELIRYAEAGKQKKLPAHPAYLEARRVLQRQASTASTSQASDALNTHAAAVSDQPGDSRVGIDGFAATSRSTRSSVQPLPPKRKAKVW